MGPHGRPLHLPLFIGALCSPPFSSLRSIAPSSSFFFFILRSSRAQAPPVKLARSGSVGAGAIPSPETVVRALYEAIRSRDGATLQQLLAPDLEWWFHGPPEHQHLKRLLTGEEERDPDVVIGGGGGCAFEFDPQEVAAFGATVVAEGFRGAVVWVHAWTVGADGVITQVREYFNTSLTVARLGGAASGRAVNCVSVWQSRLHERARKSLPGLVLAI